MNHEAANEEGAMAEVHGLNGHRTALPPVRSEPLFSISRFRSVLVKHAIIFPEAIEDAEGFDGERTLVATQAAYDELMENNRVSDSLPERKQ